MHAVSVFVGAAVGDRIPTTAITLIAGLAFLGFAAWTLRGDKLDEDEEAKADTHQPIGDRGGERGVLPRRARRQDDAGHDHARHQRRTLFGTWLGSTVRHAGEPHIRWAPIIAGAARRTNVLDAGSGE